MKKLFYGGDIITMELENDYVEAVYVEDGLIKKVGALKNFNDYLEDPSIEKIHLTGKTLLPGFIDPHSHLSMIGPLSALADLSECKNFDELIQTLKTYIKDHNLGESDVVYGFGYDHNFLAEHRHPTKDILNQVSTNIPIFISHASGHIGCANDCALTLAKIDSFTPDVEGGYIGRVNGTNEPNGYFEEESMMALQKMIFSKLTLDYNHLTKVGQEMYLKNGITTAQDGATQTDTIELFKHLAEQNDLLIDIVVYPQIVDNPQDMQENEKYAKKYYNRLKINGYKLFLDGSPQARTAWLTQPYEGEEEYRGYPQYSDEQVREFVQKAIDDDVQLLTHCNGDAASDQLLTHYSAALEKSNNPTKHELRPVMIHCQTARNDQLDKMKAIGMIPSIFVDHTYYWGDIHLKNLGEQRGNRISPAKSAFDRGLVVNLHQDAPVVKPNMLQTIWSAVNRITRKGVEIGKEERISVYDALKAVTINAAYAYFEEKKKGSISPGKVADFVILNDNPLKVDQMAIKDIQVLETIKEGNSLFKATAFQTQSMTK